ncbi:unnamed protein product [Paramecium octaurelia]|uniref:Uncharacterized protein n=1 Tax=Paramecium octaurelia TaxID=43137 RepID=A0A8S1YHX7_PAROT|nr:unnamed protein product [Paramecium octaurelia]
MNKGDIEKKQLSKKSILILFFALLQGFNKDNEAVKQQNILSYQLFQKSKKNPIETQEYHQLLKNVQNLKTQSLIDKHSIIQSEIKQLQNEYIEYRQIYQQKCKIIFKQKQVIEELDGKKAKIHSKLQEQSTFIFYANAIKLLEEMLNKDDPRNLFQYHFEYRYHFIRQKRSYPTSITNIFATQVDQVGQEIEKAPIEEERDLKLLELIKNLNNELNEFNYNKIYWLLQIKKFKSIQIIKRFEFIQLNEKKFELQSNIREINYCKYPQTSNGLLPLKLSDNFNSNQITLNLLSTSVELDLKEQRNENQVKRVENTVIRLFNFLRNNVSRVNHLVKLIQEISELVPSTIFLVLEQLKNSLYINEIIRTPTQKKSAMYAITILEQKQELVHMKHSKLLSQKQMLNTVHITKKHAHASIKKFKNLQTVQTFIKSLLSDEIERLFIQQEMLDDLTKEVEKYCEQ